MIRLLALLLVLANPVMAEDRLILGSTTTTENSGLLAAILPVFSAETGIRVDVVSLGTRQVLAMAANGDLDIVIVHHRPSEDEFIASGNGIDRRDLMFNDFILIGPVKDPAQAGAAIDASAALAAVAALPAKFVSRGDGSGTHLRELELWQIAGVTPGGAWYSEVGSGMGATLNIAAALSAYTLSDRGTWLSFENRAGLGLVFEGEAGLRNNYGLIRINPDLHPHTNATAALTFANWITGPKGQAAIGAFRLNGRVLFCPVTPQPGQQQDAACTTDDQHGLQQP